MSFFNANASPPVSSTRTTFFFVCLTAFAGLLMSVGAQARGDEPYGDVVMQRVQFRGPGLADERANERAMRQAARAQRQQMQVQPGQPDGRGPEPMNQSAPRRELAVPQAPGYRPPDPGDSRMGRPGRLSPEERRALRQQIDEAGRNVYRPR